MAWLAFLAAYLVLGADLRRRRISADPMTIILVLVIAGIAGSKIYHVLESPSELFADPVGMLFSSYGFAWFGGFLGGLIALMVMARHYKVRVLTFLDASSPAAALGYAIGRIGCLLSGDGDYGIPTNLPWGMSFPHGLVPTAPGVRVHPTPIYEFLIGVAIAWYLWKRGARLLRERGPAGEVLAEYLVITGIARFLIEYIRINPREFLGFIGPAEVAPTEHAALMWSNAQVVSLLSILAGVILVLVVHAHKSAPQPSVLGRSRPPLKAKSEKG
jgi:phosphatidylglycerol:prolipoprotein diacylglycerol transferase